MEELILNLIEIAKLFGYKYDDSFFAYLASISKPNLTCCGKEILEGEGGWKCEDCELDIYSIYCNDCFIKEKHKGHKAYFNPSGLGFCDCGTKSVIKPEGFCDKHKGDYNNINDLMNFIKSSIPLKLLDSINIILNKIFSLFIDKIKDLSDINKKEDDELFKMFDCLEIFCEKLSKSNLSLFYFVTLKFTENFPFNTNHKCFYYDENKNLISFIKKDSNKKHKCICPFMQVMIYALKRRLSKQNSSKFFSLFLQTYKNKIITSLCFMNCISDFFDEQNLNEFINMGYQLVNEIGLLTYQDQNIPFLKLFFEEIYSTCQFILNKKDYKKLLSLFRTFFQVMTHLPSIEIFDKINENHIILKLIIDICCIINYSNIFENKLIFNSFKGDRFDGELLLIEVYSLKIIQSLIKIINFDNKATVDFVFNSIIDKLIENKKYKESLTNKIYSPHITTIKCYSLFLNRFCFNYSIKNQYDLLDSYNNFINRFPRSKEISIFLYEELINYFSFIISQLYNFFAFYGFEMIDYYLNYFTSKFNFYKTDLTLMKYLLTQPEISEQFNLEKILLISDIDSCNKFMKNLLLENMIIDNAINNNIKENNLKYLNSLIEFLYLIIRDNLTMQNIAFSKVDFKFNINDELDEILYKRENKKINQLVKNEIIHYILGNNNMVNRDNCLNYIEIYFDKKYLGLVDEILKEDCDKIVLTNGLVQFSLKKEKMNLCDIDNIIPPKFRKNAIEYINNFQTKNCSLFNINIIEPLNMQHDLSKKIYQTFYNEKSINDLINFYNIINRCKEKFPLLYKIFYYNIKKILTFSYKLCLTQILDEDFKKWLLEKLKIIEEEDFFIISKENKEKNLDNAVKNERTNIKEKLKKKFEKKNELIKAKISSENMIIEKEIRNEEEVCVYCRQCDNPNNLECYGKICYYFSDYLTDILRKIEENKRIKRRKFVTCNHKMHFKCFNEFICLHSNNDLEFECPLCKKLSNIILFDYSILKKNNTILLKGIDFENENININNFFEIDSENKLFNLFFYSKLAFENYCSKLFHKQILVNDINGNKNMELEALKLINEDFEEFTMYYTKTNYKKEQIEIWKNILYNLKILYKFKIVNFSDNFLRTFNLLKIENINNLEELLNNFPPHYIINEFIIISLILFEPNKDNKEKLKNIFYKNILLYMLSVAFFKKNSGKFEEYLENEKEELKKILDLFNLKYNIFLMLFDEKEEISEVNISIEEAISMIKINANIINSINSIKIKNHNLHEKLKIQYLEIPELILVNIPESGIEFFNQAKGNCIYCHKTNLYSYFCLLCGNKFCCTQKCTIESKSKEYAAIYHSKKCCGGNGLFIDISNSEIVYLLKRKIISSNIFIYINNFGEPLNFNRLDDDYKLNKEKYNEGIMKYIDMTFRKKKSKIPPLIN